MIPSDAVTAWSLDHPWPLREQVEQDLLLSRAICAIANDDYLGQELVFRGGTALHKLHLPQPWRYSEDLDYVRTSAGGIKTLTFALTALGEQLKYEVRTRVGQHPKVLWRTTSLSGVPLRVKIEVNTYERSPVLPHLMLPYEVTSPWWSGRTEVRTFQPVELVATKIRALYQRSKGRDLFDLWLALEELRLDPVAIIAAFEPYRPDGLTGRVAAANLATKLRDPTFRGDLIPLIRQSPVAYDPEVAAERITTDLLSRLDGNSTTKGR